jgi:hypothetical protein
MKEAEFLKFLQSRNLADKTIEMAVYALKRIERAYQADLDSEFSRDGLKSLLKGFSYSAEDQREGRANPSAMDIEQPRLYRALAWYKHKLRLYESFRLGAGKAESLIEDETPEDAEVGQTFGLERDLQKALRTNIAQLDASLQIVDNGTEARVEAGFIDILAKDKDGCWVVIELKADVARPSSIAQILSYMTCISKEKGGKARGILIAADFEKKVALAAESISNLQLRKYRFSFSFE